MVVLTIALVSIAGLMAITLRLQMLGRNETAAVRLAQSKIDELIAVNFVDPDTLTENALVALGGSLTTDVGGYNDSPAIAGYATVGYKRRWQITEISGKTNIRTLTVRLIPLVSDSRIARVIELTTIIRDPTALS